MRMNGFASTSIAPLASTATKKAYPEIYCLVLKEMCLLSIQRQKRERNIVRDGVDDSQLRWQIASIGH
jgi:hypothetical protein